MHIEDDNPPPNEPRLTAEDELALQHSVWNFLCSRRHLRSDDDWDEVLDTAKPKQLARDTRRILRASFLKAVMASTYFDVPGYSQILIEGAIVRGNLNLDREVIRSGISIRNSTFTGPVNLNYVRIGYNVDFSGSVFCRGIKADSMRIDGSLYLGTGDSDISQMLQHPIACPNSESLKDEASRQTVAPQKQEWDIDALNFSKAEITGEVVISTARIRASADLSEIRIGRRLQVYNSSMDSLKLLGSNLGRLELVNTQVRNTVYSLDAEGMSVTHTVYLDKSHFAGTVGFLESEIKSDLSIRGAKFDADLDLSSARISGDLLIGTASQETSSYARPFTTWKDSSLLTLDHAEVGVVRASLLGWPQKSLQAREFRFSGFDLPDPLLRDSAKDDCYDKVRVTPFGSWFSGVWNSFWDLIDQPTSRGSQASSSALGICYYSNWLAKVDYTPSVVSWLQQKLKAVGNQSLADHVGILGKNHERDEAWKSGRYLDWFALVLSGMFIGYGYNAWLSGGWAFLFLVIGAVVFKRTSAAKRHPHASPHKAFNPVLFSFDMLLPFIQLRKEHYELHIREEFPRYYFYFHRVMGYVLGLFLIGALSGLTK